MGKTTKTKKSGYIGDKFIAKGTALTSSQFFNWRSGTAPSSQATIAPSQPVQKKRAVYEEVKTNIGATDAEQQRIRQNNRRINNLFKQYGYSAADADRNYWADKSKTNTYGSLEENLVRRKGREQSKSTAGKSIGKEQPNKLYIGETNWGNLLKQYSPQQLEYATETVGGKKYWRGDRSIANYKPEINNLDDATNVINANQQNDFQKKQAETNPQIRDSVKDTLKDLSSNVNDATNILTGGDERPEVPNLSELYKKLTTGEQGEIYKTTELEDNLSFWKNQERDIQARMRDRMAYEEGKPVAMGVISGKTSEIARQEQKNLSFANRQIAYVNDQLKTKYSMIEMVMNFTSLDYKNASNSYDKDFSQNLQTLNFIKGVESEIKSDKEKEEDNARANIQIIANNLSKGGMSFDELDDNQKLEMNKLEIKAGLPIGFLESIKNTNPKADILSTTTRVAPDGNKYADVILRNDDGSFQTRSVLLGREKGKGGGSGWATGTPTSYKEWQLAGSPGNYEEWVNKTKDNGNPAIKEMASYLENQKGSDGYVSPDAYTKAKSEWLSKGYKTSDFDKYFANLRNPEQGTLFPEDPYKLDPTQNSIIIQ